MTDTKSSRRSEILDEANCLVHGDRQQSYGPPEVNFANIAERWSQLLGVDLEPWMVGVMMADLKLARLASGPPQPDTFVDICGYAALAGELADG